MTGASLIGIAQAPLVWVVICEIFFFAYLLRDKGMTYDPRKALARLWPILRVLIIAVSGALIGLLIGRLFADTLGWLMFGLGALPGCVAADRLLRSLRPATRIWRWVATPIALLQAAVSAGTLAAL